MPAIVPTYRRPETERKKQEKLPKLPNCPFCNGPAKRVTARFTPAGTPPVLTEDGRNYVYPMVTWYGVKCKNCGVAQPKRKYMTREESDKAWTKRTTM